MLSFHLVDPDLQMHFDLQLTGLVVFDEILKEIVYYLRPNAVDSMNLSSLREVMSKAKVKEKHKDKHNVKYKCLLRREERIS